MRGEDWTCGHGSEAEAVAFGILRGRIGRVYEFWGDFRDRGDGGKERYAMQLEEVRLIPANRRPIVAGHQGWFDVSDALIASAFMQGTEHP
jgi:hypothetical protein